MKQVLALCMVCICIGCNMQAMAPEQIAGRWEADGEVLDRQQVEPQLHWSEIAIRRTADESVLVLSTHGDIHVLSGQKVRVDYYQRKGETNRFFVKKIELLP